MFRFCLFKKNLKFRKHICVEFVKDKDQPHRLNCTMSDSDDSDYVVEQFVKPDRIGRVATNDVDADLLGNFDDQKRKNIENNVVEEEEDEVVDDDGEEEDEDEGDSDDDVEETTVDDDGTITTTTKKRSGSGDDGLARKKSKKSKNGEIGDEEITALLRGVSKANRFVLYVTNLNFATSKERLAEYFSQAGVVKTVRIPKKRKGGFAFIEMSDVTAFKVSNASSFSYTYCFCSDVVISFNSMAAERVRPA